MEWRLSVLASRDLENISAYISRDNLHAAQAWIDRIIERIDEACSQPRSTQFAMRDSLRADFMQ
jgi:plasmid stabilization system protein ParE